MKRDITKTGFIVFFVLLTALFVAIAWPFLPAAFLASVLAVIFWPLNLFFQKKIGKHRYIAAAITTLIVSVCVVIPFAIALSVVILKAGDFFIQICRPTQLWRDYIFFLI